MEPEMEAHGYQNPEPDLTPAKKLAESLDRLTTPMVAVTATAGSATAGCLVGLHTQCSIDPMRVAVALSHDNHTFRVASKADALAVHYLERAHRDLAVVLGSTTGDTSDKFDDVRLIRTRDPEAVELADVPSRWVGTVVDSLNCGDHTLFILGPVSVETTMSFSQLSNSELRGVHAGHPRSP
jgi:flavin reductase (DIM6/NTAB) family NADH-FMN oxidoreductase RutF